MANRHQRRAMKAEMRTMDPSELTGRLCAWAECGARFEGEMPTDWRWLIMYWLPTADIRQLTKNLEAGRDIDRDACLCPEHARELDNQLKSLMREVTEPAAGSA
jgi:hypothetical protein